MKKIIVFIIGLVFILISCSDKSTTNFEDQTNATVLGKGMDCGLLLIELDNTVTGLPENAFGKIYYANNLPDNLKTKGMRIYVEFREPKNDELIVCHDMGPAYSHIFITNIE